MSYAFAAYSLLRHLYENVLVRQRQADARREATTEALESRMLLSAGFDHLYASPQSLPLDSGGSPESVVATDLNRDGRPDIAATDTDAVGNNISVFLNQGVNAVGDVTFSARSTYSAGDKAWRMVAADLNNDGAPELIVAGYNTGEIAVLPNDGNGVFGSATAYPASYTRGIATGDFNNDGSVDMAVATGTGISVFINDTHGAFLSPNDIAYGAGSAVGTAAADVNGDGQLDLLVSVMDVVNDASVYSLTMLTGDASGSFALSATIPLGHQPFGSVVAADLDGDGRPEAVLANIWDNSLTVVDNIASSPTLADYATGSCPRAVVAADVNGDGYLDLVNVDYQSPGHSFSVVGNRGDGTFAAPVTYEAYADNPLALAAADFAGTRYADVAILQPNSFAVDLYRNVLGREIAFPDAALNTAVHDALGITDYNQAITGAEMESLTQLDASNRGISDLTGLEYAVNLQTLSLRGNSISDLTPILGLPLVQLDVGGMNIGASGLADIASHLSNLTHLEVPSCHIDDFSSLSSLTSLQYLNINDNGTPTGLGVIGGLTSLEVLYATGTHISTTALVPLNKLRELDVLSCGIADISFLAGKQLTTLNLDHDPIGDLSWLTTQTKLWWLGLVDAGLDSNDIASVDWSKLTQLSIFFFDGNPIGSVSFLNALPQLSSLGAGGTGTSDISPLAGLTGLHYLSLGNNPIVDLSPLNNLTALQQLNINNCGLRSLGQLQWSNLPHLNDLGIAVWNNYLSTYAGGADAQIIADIRASGVSVYAFGQYVKFDDAALEAEIRTALQLPAPSIVNSDTMLGLTTLDLSGKRITSLAGIEYAEGLTSIDLRNTWLNVSPGSPDRQRIDLLLSRGVTVLFDSAPQPLVINGTAADDLITLVSSGGNLLVTIDSNATQSYPMAMLSSITVNGLAGNDTVTVGAGVGAVFAYGGDGNDTLNGGAGNDMLYGDAGDDFIVGNDGVDAIYGGDGNDTVGGGQGNDIVYGEGGNDQLHGGKGDDRLYGGKGADSLWGDKDDNYLDGQQGNDTIYALNLMRDSVVGGAGTADYAQIDSLLDVMPYSDVEVFMA